MQLSISCIAAFAAGQYLVHARASIVSWPLTCTLGAMSDAQRRNPLSPTLFLGVADVALLADWRQLQLHL